MTCAPFRVEGVSGSSKTLRDLSFARGNVDRAGIRRQDPQLLGSLLNDASTRVLELVGGRAEVIESDRDVSLALRSPERPDIVRLSAFLGQDGEGTAYVGVVGEPGDQPESPGWRSLREVGALLSDRDSGLFATMLGLANGPAAHPHCPRGRPTTGPDQAGWTRRCPPGGRVPPEREGPSGRKRPTPNSIRRRPADPSTRRRLVSRPRRSGFPRGCASTGPETAPPAGRSPSG